MVRLSIDFECTIEQREAYQTDSEYDLTVDMLLEAVARAGFQVVAADLCSVNTAEVIVCSYRGRAIWPIDCEGMIFSYGNDRDSIDCFVSSAEFVIGTINCA